LARPYNGTFESIEAMTLEDIRHFIDTRLGRNNLIVVAGGAITFDELQKLLSPLVAALPQVKTEPIKPVRAADDNVTETIEKNDIQQAYIYFGAPLDYPYDAPDQYKAKIAEYLLGGAGFGSRLMEELRVKRGLTYGAYSVLRRAKYGSYLSGYLQTKLNSQQEAIDTVKAVVRNFVEHGITQEELDAAKKFLIGSEPLRLETLSQRLHRAFDEYYYGRPPGYTKIQLEKIKNATLEEINAFIKSHPEIADLSFAVVTKKRP
jgi:predicted Zn-dependent peptidase